MAWWNDFVEWLNSATGSRILVSTIFPFLAILVAGIVAAAIGRGSATRVLAHEDRELKGAAISSLIVVGRKASIWTSLGNDERQHVDSLLTEADIRVRLIPVAGASLAADWAAHQLADMKKNSASFSFQAEQTFLDYRDRLLDWQLKPGRARKLFISDLQQWSYENDTPVVAAPQEWTPAPIESQLSGAKPPTTQVPASTPSDSKSTTSTAAASAPVGSAVQGGSAAAGSVPAGSVPAGSTPSADAATVATPAPSLVGASAVEGSPAHARNAGTTTS